MALQPLQAIISNAKRGLANDEQALLELFLNGAEFSLNSVNLEKRINH